MGRAAPMRKRQRRGGATWGAERQSGSRGRSAALLRGWLTCVHRSPVTKTQLFGYGLAFAGVMYYNAK